jgi:hypothetical protein
MLEVAGEVDRSHAAPAELALEEKPVAQAFGQRRRYSHGVVPRSERQWITTCATSTARLTTPELARHR